MAKRKITKIPKIKGSKSYSRVTLSDEEVNTLDKSCEYSVIYKKGTKWNQSPEHTYRYMECKLCGQYETASQDTISITCSDCVREMVEPPEIKRQKTSTGRPPGWHFMAEFVDAEGNVYFKGKEQPKLRGTLKPTEIEKKQRINKKDKVRIINDANTKVYQLKKQLKKAKLKKEIKSISRELKKHIKIASGKIPKSMRYK